MKPIDYCQNKVLTPGSSFYYSLLKLPKTEKHGLIALYTVCQEIQSIPEKVHEESVARAKLQWWLEELQRMLTDDARHPATQALLPIMKQQQLPTNLFAELITSVELKLTVDHCCTEEDFRLYCYREAGIRSILAAYISGFSQPQTLKFAHEIGISIAIINTIIDLRRSILQGRVYFPLDDFAKFKLEPQQLSDLQHPSTLTPLLNHQANKAYQHYDKALSLLPAADKASQRHNLTYAKLLLKLLDEIKQDGFQVLAHQIQLTPLRKLWLAWRH